MAIGSALFGGGANVIARGDGLSRAIQSASPSTTNAKMVNDDRVERTFFSNSIPSMGEHARTSGPARAFVGQYAATWTLSL